MPGPSDSPALVAAFVAVLLVGLLAGSGAGTTVADASTTASTPGTSPGTGEATVGPVVGDGATRTVTPPLANEPPGTAPELSPARSLGYFRIGDSGPGPHVPENATVAVRLATGSLPQPGHVDAVRLYRLDDGDTWRPVPTRYGGGNRFRAAAEGGRTFAVGFTEPQFAVVDVSVSRTTVRPGEAVTVRVTVDNDDAPGTTAFDLTVGGQDATKTVALAREERRQFTFDHTLRRTGTVEVAVDGVTYATITVLPRPRESTKSSATATTQRWPPPTPARRVSTSGGSPAPRAAR